MRAPTEAIKYMGKGARRRALTVQIYEAAAMPTQRLVDCCSPHEPERSNSDLALVSKLQQQAQLHTQCCIVTTQIALHLPALGPWHNCGVLFMHETWNSRSSKTAGFKIYLSETAEWRLRRAASYYRN